MKLTSGEFVLYYLRYLTKWNKTASLLVYVKYYPYIYMMPLL